MDHDIKDSSKIHSNMVWEYKDYTTMKLMSVITKRIGQMESDNIIGQMVITIKVNFAMG